MMLASSDLDDRERPQGSDRRWSCDILFGAVPKRVMHGKTARKNQGSVGQDECMGVSARNLRNVLSTECSDQSGREQILGVVMPTLSMF
mmetsp:Transcript_131528/g.196003  ORF Transcript_131528/g.196003 Transcript_131528/m.196003 type:complete len:89 (-) Transcript_131528:618-884(-)